MWDSSALVAVFAVTLLVVGCATVFTGTTDKITITTDPDDAKVYMDGRLVGTGKTTLNISRSGAPPSIKVEKRHYQPQEFAPKSEFNWVAMFNSTFVLSWGTDILSGAVVRYSKNKYHVQLVKEGAAGLTQRQKIARFSLANWAALRKELAGSEGEYIDSLASLANSTRLRTVFRAKLSRNSAELLSAQGPKKFAEMVARIYRLSLRYPSTDMAG